MHSVTILIPCFNEATVIAQKIRNCLSLRTDGADVEVLVVDDYSTDETSAIARSAGARVVRNRGSRGKWGAITTGAAAARHEILCITDADVLIGKHALIRALRPLGDPSVGAVCGVRRMVAKGPTGAVRNADSLYDVVRKAMVVFYSLLDSSPALYGPMMLVRRELIGRIEGGRLRADDVDLPVQIRKLGLKAKACPAAWFWELKLTDASHDKQATRRALGLAQAYWHHRDALFNPRLGAFGLFAYPLECAFFFLAPVIGWMVLEALPILLGFGCLHLAGFYAAAVVFIAVWCLIHMSALTDRFEHMLGAIWSYLIRRDEVDDQWHTPRGR